MGDRVIETHDLSVRFGTRIGIDRVHLRVERGEVFGFLGPNGAGKTTTMRVLLDVLRATSGTARVFGLDSRRNGPAIRKRVGYVPGELHLYPQLRARNYLQLVDSVRGNDVDRAYLGELCDRFDLDPSRPMKELSRGNKQKVGLVAAFMHRPELLVLDEPTGGLDPLMQSTVLQLVREAANEGRSVFLSSHILPEVQAVCDRVAIIRSGQIVATQSVEALTRSQFHRLRLGFERLPPDGTFTLPGVSERSRLENGLVLEVRENLSAVLRVASEYGVVDLETQPVTLEEIFRSYYEQDKGGKHA